MAAAGAKALKERLCSLTGMTTANVDRFVRLALDMGEDGRIEKGQSQGVLARVLGALLQECLASSPSDIAGSMGLTLPEAATPEEAKDLPVLNLGLAAVESAPDRSDGSDSDSFVDCDGESDEEEGDEDVDDDEERAAFVARLHRPSAPVFRH